MTYASNQTIEAQHYNLLVWGSEQGGSLVTSTNNINLLWGPGYGEQGFNQSMTDVLGLPSNQGVSPGVYNDTVGSLTPVDGVSAGDATSDMSVTSQQWIGLVSAINRSLYHQNTANLTYSVAPGFGRTIQVFAGLSTALTSIASGVGRARQTVTRNIANSTKSTPWIEASSATNKTLTITRKVVWQGGNDARWFFNAGGYVILGMSCTGATNGRSSAVAAVINDIGFTEIRAYNLSAFSGNDDSASDTSKGYWDLGTSWVQIGKNTSASGSDYATTSVTVYARVTESSAGVGTEDGAVGNQLEVRLDVFSSYGTAPFSGTGDWGADAINLSIAVSLDIKDPAYVGGMLSRTWSDPEIN